LAFADQVALTEVRGVRLEQFEAGRGLPLLFLNAGMGIDPGADALALLAQHHRVLAPSHPGFGRSERPTSFTTADDLAYFYLDLIDAYDLHDVALVGVSFGAWIAAEIAVKSTARISHLILGNPVGIKVSDRETRDIADIFAMTEDEFNAAAFADPRAGVRDYKAMSDADVLAVAQNREALARFGWSPYMHNPKLKSRLHRVSVPTLVLCGEKDSITSQDYGRAYCAAIPGAHFDSITAAGHLPHLEQPMAFASKVIDFIGSAKRQ
jgi:pimeloyl-ACP methyl ester carboxylesterase